MSQSLLITGFYRNGRTTSVGTHIPQNNRVITDNEIVELQTKLDGHILPILWKFRKLVATTHLQNGKKITIEYGTRENDVKNIMHFEVYRLLNDTL